MKASHFSGGLVAKNRCLRIGLLILILLFEPSCSDDQSKSIRLPSQKPSAVSSEVGTGDLYALVVGVSTYRHNKIPKLKLADKDARDFAAFLKSQDKLFRNIDVSLLVNEEATEREIRKYLDYKLSRATKDDTVIVFFSGHGAADPRMPGDSFFVTYDAEADYLASTAVNLSQSKFLKRLAAKRAILFADTCHAGGFSNLGTKTIESPLSVLARQIKDSEGKVLLASSRDDEVSIEKPGLPNGVFTHYLLQGLKGEAAGKDGIVTLNDLYNYVHKKTVQETGGIQHPRMVGDLEGLFPLALTRASESAPSIATTTKPVESPTQQTTQDYKERLEREKLELAKLQDAQRQARLEKERLDKEKQEMQREIERQKGERDRLARLHEKPPQIEPSPGSPGNEGTSSPDGEIAWGAGATGTVKTPDELKQVIIKWELANGAHKQDKTFRETVNTRGRQHSETVTKKYKARGTMYGTFFWCPKVAGNKETFRYAYTYGEADPEMATTKAAHAFDTRWRDCSQSPKALRINSDQL